MTRQEKIMAFMRQTDYKPLMLDELASTLAVPHSDYHEFESMLNALVDQGQILKNKKGRYSTAEKIGLLTGQFIAGKNGCGFVRLDNKENDIFIYSDNTAYAMNGDTVLVRITKDAALGRQREGSVVRVLERVNKQIIGKVVRRHTHFALLPIDRKIALEILLSRSSCEGIQNGDSVVAQIIRYPEEGRPAKAKVVEFIGAPNHPATDTSCIIRQFDIPHEFSPNSISQAEATEQEVLPAEIEGRRDFRGFNIFTIDGEDARDLDDAVHVEMLEDGTFRLGVHIADVSYYVGENTAIDLDAFERATSVYFPDRVVPMLPVELSNGICSLNPNVDRLAFSVIMDISPWGEVLHFELAKSVIRSCERMTYSDVSALIDGNTDELNERYSHILSDIANMSKLADTLRNRRSARGSIDFDFPETKVVIGENGKVVDIKPYEVGTANHVIEEFMLITNEVVARFAFENELPFVYRVHEPPSADRTLELAKFLHNFDIKLEHSDTISPAQMQAVLQKIADLPAKQIISSVMLRAMMKAQYDPKNLGHFGLAAEYYCHFTSPIRRYPDLVIHRILSEKLGGKLGKKRLSHLQDFTARAAKQSTDMEIRATEAERDADKLKICEYMQQFLGQEFDAVIASVVEFGMFVSLPNTAEGLISMRALTDDYYVFDKGQYQLVGERTGKIYALGDEIKVRLVSSSPQSRQIDFVPADIEENPVNMVKSSYDKPATKSLLEKKKSKAGKNKKATGDFRKFAKKHGGKKKR